MPVYLTLQPIRRAALCLTAKPGGLLPHLFTLAPGGDSASDDAPPPFAGAVIFCHVASAVTRGFPLGSMALFVARTFLMRFPKGTSPATDRPADYCGAKLVTFLHLDKQHRRHKKMPSMLLHLYSFIRECLKGRQAACATDWCAAREPDANAARSVAPPW